MISKLTKEQQEYALNHDKMFLEGWKCGIDCANENIVKEVIGFINRSIPEGGYEFLPATEHRGGFFGGYAVAKLDNNYIREKLGSLLQYLDSL